MLTIRIFCLLFFLPAVRLMASLPPGCDTLITMDGRTLLIRIQSENEREIRYTRCEAEGGGIYAMSQGNVQAIKRHQAPPMEARVEVPVFIKPILPPALPKTAPKHAVLTDSFAVLTFKDGHSLQILILEQDFLNLYYRMYDDPADDREYVISNRDIRFLQRSRKGSRISNLRKDRRMALIMVAILLLLVVVNL
ncbi:MAG: hypothetical protein ABIO24_06200 [Saprospiraceae bacterium]